MACDNCDILYATVEMLDTFLNSQHPSCFIIPSCCYLSLLWAVSQIIGLIKNAQKVGGSNLLITDFT